MRKVSAAGGEAASNVAREYRSQRRVLKAAPTVTTALLVVSMMQSPALSQTRSAAALASARPSFNIPAQPLSQALVQFSTASGVQVFVNAGVVRGINSPGASGALTPAVALSRILQGSGLTYRFTNANTVAIERDSTTAAGGALPAGAIALDTIDVQGANNPNSTMTPMPAYAGGQVATGGQVGILGNRDMMNTPFSQTSYTSKTIENQQSRFLADVVNNDPAVQATNPSTGTDLFNIRGFSIRTAHILFNGLQGVAPTDFDAAMTESAERVEILKGPSSLLNGMVANVGGIINIVPKRAGDVPLTQITPDYTMNSQFGGHVDIGRRFGENKEFGIRFNGVYRGGDTPINHQSREQKLATLGLDYRGERLRVGADLGYQQQRVQGLRRFTFAATGIQVPKAPDNRTNWFDPAEFSDGNIYYGTVRGEYDLTNQWTAYFALGGSDRKQTRFTANRTIINSQGGLAAGVLSTGFALTKVRNATMEGGLRGQFDTGPIKHQVSLGYTTYNQDWGNDPGTGVAFRSLPLIFTFLFMARLPTRPGCRVMTAS